MKSSIEQTFPQISELPSATGRSSGLDRSEVESPSPIAVLNIKVYPENIIRFTASNFGFMQL